MHPFITGDPLVGTFVPPDLSGGNQRGSGSGGGGGGRSSGNAPSAFNGHGHQSRGYQVQGNSSGGASGIMAGNSHTSGYGGAAQQQRLETAYANETGGHEVDSVYNYAYPISSGRSSMDGNLTIPGSFPVKKSNDHPSVTKNEQCTAQTAPQFYRRDSKGRIRATTISYSSGGVLHSQSTNLNMDVQNLLGHAQTQPFIQQQAVGGSFLGVDPSTLLIGGSLAADSAPQGISGHYNAISLSGSDYSGESVPGWAINRYENSNNNLHGMTDNHGTRTGSPHDYKAAQGEVAQRHYLLNERQQQRLAQQQRLYQSEFGETLAIQGEYNDDGLVPLTRSAHSHSRTYVERKDDSLGTAVAQDGYDVQESIGPHVVGLRRSPVEGSNSLPLHTTPSTRNESAFGGGSNGSSALSVSVSGRQSSESRLGSDKYAALVQPPASLIRSGAGIRLVSNFSPLTLPSTPGSSSCNQQCVGSDCAYEIDDVASNASAGSFSGARDSETSYSLYSAESGGDDDGYLTHGNGIGDVDSWVDGESDMRSASGESTSSHNYLDITQPLVFVESAKTQKVGDSNGSIYRNPRFSPQNRGLFSSIGSPYIASHGEVESAGGKSDRDRLTSGSSSKAGTDKDWESDGYDICDNIEDGSVISQEDRAVHEGALPHSELDESPSFANLSDWPQKSKDTENIFEGLETRDSSSDTSSRYSANLGGDGGDSDVENTGPAQQDTVVFVGKLRPAQSAGGVGNTSILSKVASAKRGSSGNLAGLVNSTAQSLDHMRLSPSPIPFSVRNMSMATYPQKIAKKTQVHPRRASRASLAKENNMRMIESLRRMGKLKDPEAGYFGTSNLADGPSPALC
ncbi:hypothetical protein GGI22_005316 [Coemansia erecta]|nr:hypothetical protein GGI22_005316 [Coemansia erecta]